ncbi:hypothetical protein GH714_038612 [Hevea brasiliensis]|uniref:Nuclear transcription factor Y subunit n=1 Tax=Hevea brasiliensis TaxID=3981 RepID=A0A6A6KG90_HEVBR|nr:hypothetical protein GH714_038612 [Hevea brasiliensis]
MKPVFLFSSPEIALNFSQTENSHSVACAPSPYADNYFGGLFTPYGLQTVMAGMTTARVPLPLDLADDGPIYVNAKQYHGILRRRRLRSKLEARNKLVKRRKSEHRFSSLVAQQTNGDLCAVKPRHCVSIVRMPWYRASNSSLALSIYLLCYYFLH